ncbi:MAG: hypothetical protein HQK78_19815 [Desulfobacterales bacterium]|nr:hypothetical protein [Desulfobacterales bacterium]
MIGIDRPLRAEWIYETLKMVETGTNPSIYNEQFENIAKELIGKEGKRKVRTIIFRSFIYSLQDKNSIIQPNIFIESAKKCSLDEIKPLFIFKILIDYEIARYIIKKIAVNMDSSNKLSCFLLSKLMVKEYGDRDVVKRSIRAFLSTLVNFGILSQIDKNNYILCEKLKMSDENIKDFIILYSKVFLKSKVVDINNIEPEFFFFFQSIDLQNIAYKYNGIDWEYIRDVNRNLIMIKNKK